MKKGILSLLFVLCCVMFSVAQTGKITVKGKIDGIKSGTLYLTARSSE